MNETIESSFEHLQEIIKDIRFAMFITHAANGELHAWPMTTQKCQNGVDSRRLRARQAVVLHVAQQ